MIVRRSQTGHCNIRFLRNLPIVIANDDGTAAIMQFQNRILQRVWHTEARQSRTQSADENLFRIGSGTDEAANTAGTTGLNQEPRGSIQQGRVGRGLLSTQTAAPRRLSGTSITRRDGR